MFYLFMHTKGSNMSLVDEYFCRKDCEEGMSLLSNGDKNIKFTIIEGHKLTYKTDVTKEYDIGGRE